MGLILKAINWQGWVGLAAVLALGAALVVQTVHARHWHKQSDRFELLYTQERAAFQETVADYRAAAEKARQQDAANAARVAAEQTAINKKVNSAYETRIADARAHADRLRQQLEQARAHPGGPAVSPVPGLSAAPGGSDGAAPEDRLSIGDRLTATEQAIQLDEIQKWVREQHEVNPNGGPHSSH